MKLSKLLKRIEETYPLFLQYSWDNSGLNIGDLSQNVDKVLLTLEITEDTINEAIKNKVDLIISHHPFLFSKINKIEKGDIKGKLIYKLISNSISVYCMHTNYDIAFGGLNDYFMKIIGIEDSEILEIEGKNESYFGGKEYGLGRVGKLSKSVGCKAFVDILKEKLGIDSLRYVGNTDKRIEKVAVVTGAGAEFFENLIGSDIDALVTGDMKYHQAMDAASSGVVVLDCGHYGTEHIFADSIKEFLEANVKEVEFIISKNIVDPFTVM